MKRAYRPWNPRGSSLEIVARAAIICADYASQGYSLTLRQLYYQFVSRGWIANNDREYKRLGGIIDDARMAGLLDWDWIVDRTRTLRALPVWGTPHNDGETSAHAFIQSVIPQFRTPLWDTQSGRMEVWIEKDALIDVIKRPAERFRMPYFASRGYNSQSNAWAAARRIEGYFDKGAKWVTILHLGDHDPEGLDMTRDIGARFKTFMRGDGFAQESETFEIRRIALNMNQVEQYNPPPNPAKPTSSRYDTYVESWGETCWELDALDPPTIDALITGEIEAELDQVAWEEAEKREAAGTALLANVSAHWKDVAKAWTP